MKRRWPLIAGCVLFACSVSASGGGAQRILVAGDSTASSYPQSRAPQAGWGQVLDYYLGENVVLINRAVSGRSTRSFIDEGKWNALLAELRAGDTVLISFGHNDSRDDAPARYAAADGAYKDNLVRFAEDVHRAGAVPVLLSPAARRLWEGPAMVETHGLYAVNARLAATESGAGFIDLANLSLAYFEQLGREETKQDFLWLTAANGNSRFPDGVEDNTHFTALGACGVALVVARSLTEFKRTKGLVDNRLVEAVETADGPDRPAAVTDCAAQATWLPDRN